MVGDAVTSPSWPDSLHLVAPRSVLVLCETKCGHTFSGQMKQLIGGAECEETVPLRGLRCVHIEDSSRVSIAIESGEFGAERCLDTCHFRVETTGIVPIIDPHHEHSIDSEKIDEWFGNPRWALV